MTFVPGLEDDDMEGTLGPLINVQFPDPAPGEFPFRVAEETLHND